MLVKNRESMYLNVSGVAVLIQVDMFHNGWFFGARDFPQSTGMCFTTTRFVVSRVLKDEKDRKQLSFLEGEKYDYFFFVTNKSELLSEEVV